MRQTDQLLNSIHKDGHRGKSQMKHEKRIKYFWLGSDVSLLSCKPADGNSVVCHIINFSV